MTGTRFSYNKVRLILDYLFSLVFPKVFDSVKSDYFVLGAKIPKQLHIKFRNMIFTFLMCGDLVHYCTTSFNKAWAQALRRFKPCSRRVGDLRWWGSLTVVPAGNKGKRLSSVNHTTKTIHHHYQQQQQLFKRICSQSWSWIPKRITRITQRLSISTR